MSNISWDLMVSNPCENGLISNSKLLNTGRKFMSKTSYMPSTSVQCLGELGLVRFLQRLLPENL